jgi:hypothetical protein
MAMRRPAANEETEDQGGGDEDDQEREEDGPTEEAGEGWGGDGHGRIVITERKSEIRSPKSESMANDQ